MAIPEGTIVNGVNGHNHAVTNGVNGNGHGAPKGAALNGHSVNGHATNGPSANGEELNGHSSTIPSLVNGSSSSGEIPIAICGMAVRLPGGVATPQQFWEFLVNKGDGRCRVPETRYNVSTFYSGSKKPGSVITEYGYFLDESMDLGALDTSFFTMSRSEVERTDPQQRMMLEVARECFEDAGVTNWRGKTIGCYIGNFGEDWLEMFAKEPQQWGMHRAGGYGDYVISNRVSYEMDLRGPSMTIRTACSSALIALNEACVAIRRGDCEAALVGGANLILAPGMTTVMTEQGVLSPDGSCKSFSADANGYARGEAITAIFVKPLSHAIRDGNPVRAVIRSSAVNVDGKTPGMSAPSTLAHEAMIRRAYEVAGIDDFSRTAMVECHGTGTAVGDPIEANAVARVFGESGIYIGSVKPNVGHSEGASGLVSVIKSILALEHRTIPPNIRFTSPNPAIPFESAKLTVPVEPTPWPQSRYERVSVNSFGIGGANAHVILDSAASFGASAKASKYPTTPQLLLFSANSAKSLTRMTANLQQFVEKHPESVGDLAYTLANRREHLPQRTFAISNDGVMGALAPPVKAGSKPSLVMVFTGQGAQWPQMGRELLKTNPTFQASIRSLDRYLQSMDKESPHYSIEEELLKPGKKSRLSTAELSQPLCTAVQIALVDTLKALAIDPDAVVGHSSGEIAAAYAVGALTAEEAIATAHYRGAVASKQTKLGAMAAIGMSWTDTEKCLIPKVTIACDNSPKNVTISGDAEQVKAVVAEVSKSRPDVMARLLQVDKAYHSYHMAEVGDYYRSLIGQKMVGKAPTKLFFSSVSGNLLTEEEKLDARYWQTNLESPVRFREAVTSILKHEAGKNGVFLEIGPHSALAGPLRQIFTQASSSAQYVSAMIRNQNAIESLLTAVGKLYSLNVPIDLKSLIPNGSCLPDLPRYPWNHEDSYWYESRVSREWRSRKHAYHDLLGVRVAESSDLEPVWRNLLHLQNAPWIRDHKVGDDIVYPFAGYIALAGEAIRQLSGVEEGFSLQNIIVGTALVLPEGKPTEIVTTFRPRRLTTSLNSQWWEFTVASYNGHAWTKHCTGEVSPLSSDLRPAKEPEALPRKVGPRKWYETMRRAGLDLGPAFQNLETVDTSTDSENKATGKVVNGRQGDEANYHIHPTVIDGTLQLLGAASVNGYSRKYKNWLPTIIEKVHITRCLSDMVSSVSAKATGNSSVVGEGRCTSGGKTVLEVSGIRISLAEGSLPSKSADDHAAGRKEWSPDLDFMDVNELITLPKAHAQHLPLLNELGQLCLLSSSKANKELGAHLDHIQKYKNWIESHTQSIEMSAISSLDDDTVSAKIQDLVQRLSNTPASAAANALYRVCTKSNVLMSGKPLEGVISNDVMTDLYSFIDKCDRTRFIQNLGHFKPNLRVLEIGAGRGSLASEIVKELTLDTGKVCCSKYTLTTTAFVNEKDQQKIFDAMEYATLDISENLAEQNFEDRQYDLIIVTNGLYACKNLHTSLINIKKLLHPDGRLLLQEICPSSTWVKYIFATSPSFWIGDADGRPNEPYVGAERWESELFAAGFGALDALVQDQLTAVMVARPSRVKAAGRITVLCPEQSSNRANQLLERLEKEGYELDRIKIEDHPPAGQDVISVLDLDGPFFHDINAAQYQAFKEFLSRLGDSGVMWITEMCQMGCKDPRYGQTFGLVRNIRSEKQLHFATCEVDDFLTSSDEIVKVFNKFHSREENDKLKPDFEYCIRNGEINIGRVYPVALKDELLTSEPTDKVMLDVGTPGRLNTLYWSRQAVSELQSDQVEIEVYAVGLNFRDVLIGMGIIELPERVFGLESAGVIRHVGPDVKDLKVGDRVACIENRAFSTSIRTTQSFCSKIPHTLSFIEAATMIIPYTTVIHSLITVGGLVKDQSVLIHSACGGVGLAAIQVSRMLGADIYVTVGSEEKVKFLMETFNIPRNRIFNSRDTSFVDGIMRETKGKGVDVVLNSLSGELLHATWTCVAEYGKMVEIGKRDLIGGGKLDMNTFLANRTYSCVDIDQFRKVPGFLKRLLDTALEYLENGDISPVRPIKVFNAASTAEAFLAMSKGLHIGRIAVSIREAPEEQLDLGGEIARRPIRPSFKSSASYLLIGGLGGLGRAISTWMVDNNAGELIYLSRSAGAGPEDQAFVKELHSMGCDVKLVRGSVTELEDVNRAIQAATLPLKGIIQMSMVVRDRNFTVMTYDDWIESVAPKVQGTWNLHNATMSAGIELDFFVLFSSLSGVFGQPGQANYASANTFLDAFSQYRKGLGLAASVIDLGSVADVGFFEKNQDLLELLRMVGFKGVPEQHMLDAMTAAVSPRPATKVDSGRSRFVAEDALLLGIGAAMPLSDPNNRAIWRDHRPMAIYHNEAGKSGGSAKASNETLKSYLATVKADISILKTPEAANVFAVEIGRKLFDLLLNPEEEVNTSLPLVDLGLDSIVALELRSWWKQVFSFDISVLEMLGMGSLDALGQHAAEGLLRIATEENGKSGSE